MNRNGFILSGIAVALIALFCNQGTAWGSPSTPSAPSAIDELLDKTARRVEHFWRQASSFACTESVVQEKIGKNGKAEFMQSSVFDYVALTGTGEEGMTVEELRLSRDKDSKKKKRNPPPLLNTNGFPTLLLIFHPSYRASYHFRIDTVEPGEVVRVAFEHLAGARSTSALALGQRIYPLSFRGAAWIDNESGDVLRISAQLVSPMSGININAFSVDVAYELGQFASIPEPQRLPAAAVINVQTAGSHWRNTHSYSEYKLFSVDSVQDILK